MKSKFIPLLFVICSVGCNSGSDENSSTITVPAASPKPTLTTENMSIPNNSAVAEYRILFMGNSHVSGMAEVMRTLLEIGAPQKNIEQLRVSGGGFLAERLDDGKSIEVLTGDDWSHVIFQAQKYSQSGQFDYPTVGAQTWLQMAKAQNSTPILFPEHPQQGDTQEGQKVHDLHVSISNKQSSCVAPVGLAWDKVISILPSLALHQADGNHANETGKFLTALVLYESITGLSADLLPYITTVNIDASTQDLFGQIVSEVTAEHPPCNY